MKQFFLLFNFLIFSFYLFADSPLTSTTISKAYRDVEIIKIASTKGGILTNDLIEYLLNESSPIQLKVALINELGWDTKGKNNGKVLMNHLIGNKFYSTEDELFEKGSGEILICVAYLLAMDDYFNVDQALKWANKAKDKSANSYTIHMIASLIQAQKFTQYNWCQVYKCVKKVRNNKSLSKDMNDEAVKIIFGYIDKYKKCCRFRIFRRSMC